MTQATCRECHGTGQRINDEHHISPCGECCTHPNGWWKLEKHYGNDNGKYACKRGCGTVVDTPPDNEEYLMDLTRDALADVLGRDPTRQEILRAHAGFKRMAFHLYEHLRHKEKETTDPQW